MTIVRWEPLRELTSLQTEMNRLFNSVFDAPSASGSAGGARRWVPAMDLVETPDDFVLRADLPGMTRDDVKLEIEENVLTVSGERQAEHAENEQGFYRLERAFGTFSRSLTLPKGVDGEAVSASFRDGVLEVHIPKPAQAKPRRVEIAVGGEDRDDQKVLEGSAA
jgi:HSP20 family protein